MKVKITYTMSAPNKDNIEEEQYKKELKMIMEEVRDNIGRNYSLWIENVKGKIEMED